jgi:poly-gamma-glutamate synthesis protein (capsule biosynthesis protein)
LSIHPADRLIVPLIIVVTALAGLSFTAVAQSPTPACIRGDVQTRAYSSAILGLTMRYTVYLPPCYQNSAEKYPVVYLMHGSNSNDQLWVTLGLPTVLDKAIADGSLPPMIVAMPYGEWVFNINRFDSVSWGNVFLEEFMPAVETTYRVESSAQQRAIGGISRGGFWAFHIALKHPELFTAVGGHSAFFDLNHAPPAHNPLFLAEDAPGIDGLRISLDRGAGDYAYPGLDEMHARLNKRGIAHTYTIFPVGDHSNAYWKAHVFDYLAFYAATWQREYGQLPVVQPGQTAVSTMPPTTGFNTLFVPVVSFPSLLMNVSGERLAAIAAGGADPDLVLDTDSYAALRAMGMPLAVDTRVVAPDQLLPALWGERTRFSLLGFDRLTLRMRMLRVDESLPLDLAADAAADYPFAFNSAAPNYDPAVLTRFLLSGVTAITRGTQEAFDANGIQWAGEAIRPYTTRADFFHISNEVSFHPTCSNVARIEEQAIGPFCSKLYSFSVLPYIGVDIVELSGNHNLDFGVRPYLDTLRLYHDNGMLTVGGGQTVSEAQQPLIIEHHGTTIGMVSCNWAGPQWALATATSPGAAWCDRSWLRPTLNVLRDKTDVVIVSIQYKEVDTVVPPDAQMSVFRTLSDWGADVVIGSQAHLSQTFEFHPLERGGVSFIHYGLGNLFFDQTFMQKRFFMDQLFIYRGRVLTVDLFAGITDDAGRPRQLEDTERMFFMRQVFTANNWPSELPRR